MIGLQSYSMTADTMIGFQSLLLLARLINRQVEEFQLRVSFGAVHSDSTVSVVGVEGQSERWWML